MHEEEQKKVMEQLKKDKELKKRIEKTIEECQNTLDLVNNRIAFYERLYQLGEICDILEGICNSM